MRCRRRRRAVIWAAHSSAAAKCPIQKQPLGRPRRRAPSAGGQLLWLPLQPGPRRHGHLAARARINRLAARARSNILRMHCLPCPAFHTFTLVIMTKSDLLHWRHDMAAACQPLKWRKSLRGPRSEPCATSCRRRAGPAQSGGRRCRPFPRQRRCWLWNAATAATGGPTGLHSRLHLPAA